MNEFELLEYWEKYNTFLDLQMTPFEETVGKYVCILMNKHPMSPIDRISDRKHYRAYQYYGIRYSESLKKHLKDYINDKAEIIK